MIRGTLGSDRLSFRRWRSGLVSHDLHRPHVVGAQVAAVEERSNHFDETILVWLQANSRLRGDVHQQLSLVVFQGIRRPLQRAGGWPQPARQALVESSRT